MSRSPSKKPRPHALRRSELVLIVAAVVVFGALGAAAIEQARAPAPPPPTIAGNLTVNTSGPTGLLDSAFWGANTLSGINYGASQAAQFRATPITYALWPGGTGGDALNMTSNVLYHDDGSGYQLSSNEGAFVAWCRSVGCHAIFQLPAEIDNPRTAAYEVAFTERTLGFHPDYWEIGNEPAQWRHFGVPWTQWNTSQRLSATAVAYAGVVHAYALAVRAVDPAARILGLPGVGTGSQGEPQWIRASLAANAGLVSGVAIHVYPAGVGPTSGGASLAAFLNSLGGGGALPARIPADRAALAVACVACAGLPIFVTELGSATVAPAYAGYMQGFPQVPFLAAEVAQAIELNVTNLDIYSLQSSAYPGALFDGHGTPRPAARLYSEVFPYLGHEILGSNLSVPVRNVYAAATESTVTGLPSVLVANANTSVAVRLNASFAPPPVAASRVALVWSEANSAPVFANGTAAGSVVLTLPPASVGLIAFEPASVPASVPVAVRSDHSPYVGAANSAPQVLGIASAASPGLASAPDPRPPRRARRGRGPRGGRRPRGVLFDVGSVLLRYKDEWLFRSVARRWGLPIEETTETLRVLRNDLQAGRLDEAALWRRFARAFGIAPPRVPRGLWAESLRRRGRPNGEVVAIARDLRAAGCRVGILSNTDASHVAYFRARGWFSDFRPWLLSHELRAVKPEPLAFRRAARRFGVAPGRILLIDDALANVVAARSLGWDAVRYRNARGLRRELAHRGLLASVGTNSPGRERGSGRHSGTNRS